MTRYKRIQGGERNKKSGKVWTEEELSLVLGLYLEIKGQGIHENNPKIHCLAKTLYRTVRSLEAQLLMFRNLDRHGDYSFRNMSKLCVKLWKEHIDKLIK
jgi:hypothetical protein